MPLPHPTSPGFDQVGFQRDYYDRHFAARTQVLTDQLAHPLFRSWYDRLARRAYDAVGVGSPGGPDRVRLLEVGSGEGLLGSALHRVACERGIALDYTGTDLSQAALDQARPSVTGTLVCGDASEVVAGLPPASADLVVVKNLLHHLDDPAELLGACARVVAPGGCVVAVEACLGAPQFWVFSALAPRRERYFFRGRRRNTAAIAAAGLVVRRAERFSWLPYELLLAVRFPIFRRLLGSADARFLDRVSALDDRLARAVPQLASYIVWETAPAPGRSITT